jgi:uncharacterized membrane protein YeaQ/YmgE (transglycosylase-associated protein family)
MGFVSWVAMGAIAGVLARWTVLDRTPPASS